MRKVLIAVAIVALSVGQASAAPFSISGSVGGAPTGVTLDNLDWVPLGSVGGSQGGLTVGFEGGAAAVQGSVDGQYAAPYLSGDNGRGFGSPDQPNGVNATTYLTTGVGAVTLQLPGLMKYFGLLWGSVDGYNTLSFYNGNAFVGSITGSDVSNSPNGDQGVQGTLYVNINSIDAFDRVVATSSNFAFEFDNIAYDEHQVPEPASLLLIGTGLVALGRRLRRRA